MRIAINISIVCLCLCNLAITAKIPPKNLSVINEFSVKSAEILGNLIDSSNIKNLEVKIFPPNIGQLIVNRLAMQLDNKGIILYLEDSIKHLPFLTLNISNAGVAYEKYSIDDDSLNRVVTMEINGFIDNNGHVIPVPLIYNNYNDIISRDDIPNIEDKNYSFCHSEIPERDNWLYKSIIEPVIIVGTAAIAVILLFTVRSQ